MSDHRLHLLSQVFGWVTGILMGISLYAAFVYAPPGPATAGGIAQRIFYFHVPSAWLAFLAFFVVFVASILFLWKKDRTWDIVALSSAEVGVLFTSLVLLTGPIWAKPTWGTWWVWDARLTSTLVLWLIYVAYLMLRSFAGEEERGARFAAVFGIAGFVDVPIVYFSIRWWRTMHPAPVVAGGRGGGLHTEMFQTLLVALMTFTFFFLFLLIQRIRLERTRDLVEEMKRELAPRFQS